MSTIDKDKLCLMVLNEWQQNSDPNDAAKNINKTTEKSFFTRWTQSIWPKYIITPTQINEWYEKFDNDITEFFDEKSPLYVFSNQCNKNPLNLINSLVLITGEKYSSKKMLTKNGRFFIFPFKDKKGESFISVYDLFHGKERKNLMLFDITRTTLQINGKFLIAAETFDTFTTIYTLKVDYENLSVEKLQLMNIVLPYVEFLADQLDNKKCVIVCSDGLFMLGQIEENGQIIINDNKKQYRDFLESNKRLVGNKLRGFNDQYSNSIAFHELNFDNMESKYTWIKRKQNTDDEKTIEYQHVYSCCWSKNYFYGFYKMINLQYQLLRLDFETHEWTDLKIVVNSPVNMFVDEDEILILKVGDPNKINAFYRIDLKKPYGWMPSSILTTVRLLNLCESDE